MEDNYSKLNLDWVNMAKKRAVELKHLTLSVQTSENVDK